VQCTSFYGVPNAVLSWCLRARALPLCRLNTLLGAAVALTKSDADPSRTCKELPGDMRPGNISLLFRVIGSTLLFQVHRLMLVRAILQTLGKACHFES